MRRGDYVRFQHNLWLGIVTRVAKDGSWADVDWGRRTKRQREPEKHLVVVITTTRTGRRWLLTREETLVDA